ncbi:class I SAM-dependent methyltransferase [Bradyrhizobium canariense]|uniref:class I SAM-dependent methyltransferase n=1 Tax=Bradyrhizobium canariense TaxID=255045 RepID=UPI0013748053|nr:class I SAM-dependent methyltransferase [Bradyrhizobium canariense]
MAAQSENFQSIYRQFEDQFRGSRALIKQRLSIYLPFLESTTEHLKAEAPALDLGCGRGEWLELLSENGWRAIGVDLNEGMAQAARDQGLSIVHADILQYLRDQPDTSAAIITAFHVVEHLPVDYVIELLHECHRVLRETGVLILETPNPENVTVGTWSFHLDPSHNKPLPPPLLQFFVQSSGFRAADVVRLNGSTATSCEGPLEQFARTLLEASMDYSVVAQKIASDAKIDLAKVESFARAVSQKTPSNTLELKALLKNADDQITMSQNELVRQGSDQESLKQELRRQTSNQADLIEQIRRQGCDQATLRNDVEEELRRQKFDHANLRNELKEELDRQKLDQANLRNQLEEERRRHELHEFSLKGQLSEVKKNSDQLTVELAAIHRSMSWRVTAPFRRAKQILLRLFLLVRS